MIYYYHKLLKENNTYIIIYNIDFVNLIFFSLLLKKSLLY